MEQLYKTKLPPSFILMALPLKKVLFNQPPTNKNEYLFRHNVKNLKYRTISAKVKEPPPNLVMALPLKKHFSAFLIKCQTYIT